MGVPWLPQNPGIGGIDELTDAETLLVQQLAALGDPNADRILFWDDSAGQFAYLTVGSGLDITGTTLTSTVTAYTDEQAQDAVGGMVNSTLTYNDGAPSLGINLSNANTWAADQSVPDEAYDATNWNGSMEVPTKNAIRDKIETMLAASGITRTVVVTSGSATMGSSASTDYVYFVAGAHTMSLPAASGNTNRYTVKNNHSAAITIDTAGAELIEGAASISINPGNSVDIVSDDTNWYVV